MGQTETIQPDGLLNLDEGVQKERAYIARMSRLNGIHWLAVLLSVLLTTGAWYFTNLQVHQQTQNRFDRYADQVTRLVRERMMHYEDTLASAVATVHAMGGDVTHAQWVEFTQSLDIDTKYPGINGMGVIYKVDRADADRFLAQHRATRPEFRIHPEHENDILYPITYIEPVDVNMAAVGLDMAHEANRLAATLQSRDTGLPQITAPIVLVQDAQQTPGFLFYMPIYKDDPSDSLQERQENFVGMIYAPFVFKKLIEGLLDQENRLVRFAIRDENNVLYSEQSGADADYEPEFQVTLSEEFYGRNWTFEIWETPQFRAATHSNEPIMILVGGLIIDGLLFSLFVLLANSNNRALSFADRMTEEARNRAESLQRSNEDLERFAYVASHDLKTPLRGIGFLAECIRDDLKNTKPMTTSTELQENLLMLDDQVRHMDDLITGILAYSSVRSQIAEPEFVETSKLIHAICVSSGLKPDQFQISGDPVTFSTDAIRLQQVLQNLIGNAYKYHPDPKELSVSVTVTEGDERLDFEISDNGMGIDPRYHDKIFEMFQTLNAEKNACGTGIGLAIVKKIVNLYGGEIRLESEPGMGCSFSFDWPKQLKIKPAAEQVAA